MAALNAKSSDAELENKLANDRRLARLQAMKEQELLKRESREHSDSEISRTNVAGGGNFSNNINVQINYTVNETNVTNRRKKGKKSQSVLNDKKRRMKDLMNSSLSKMLDQQLLMSSETPVDRTKNVGANAIGESLTEKIFHGDKIYLNNGAMAFKPLGMETVLEMEEQTVTPSKWKKKGTQTNTTRISSNNFVPQTTEQNIEMQQRLDFASAEEFVSFTKQSQMGLLVSEEKQKKAQAQVSIEKERALTVVKNLEGSLTQSKSVSMAQLPLIKQQIFIPKNESKSSLKTVTNTSPAKRVIPEEDRQVHPGLAKIQFNLKKVTVGITTPPLEEKISNFNQEKSPIKQFSSVKFDESSITRKRNETNANYSSPSITSGALTIENAKPAFGSGPKLGDTLHRQTTGNSKQIARKLRDMQNKTLDEQEQNLAVDIVLENPLPKPHRMRSRATFQPQSTKLEPNLVTIGNQDAAPVHDDSVSQLAIDYGMHVQNQNKVKHLMELILGKKGSFVEANINEVEIDIGDSMSNVDKSQGPMTKRANLPSIGRESVTDEPASTQLGTNLKHSVMNLAEYTRKQNEKLNARNPPFDFSINQSLSAERQTENIAQSLHNRSISIDSQKELKKQRKSELVIQESYAGLHDASKLDNLVTMQNILKGQELDSRQRLAELRMQMPGSSLSGVETGHRKSLFNKGGLSNKNSKFAMVRSSMFNKNPILDRMDMVHMLSEQVSDYSVGNHTNFNRKINAGGGLNLDNQAAFSYNGAGNDYEKYSVKSNSMVRSISHKKLEPLIQKGSQEGKSTSTLRTQSLHFDKGLSYVMIKGKVRPSENYIYKAMLPYTNVQGFQSLQVKSSTSRHQLLLTQMPPKSQHSPHRVPHKGKKRKNQKDSKKNIQKAAKKDSLLQTVESARKKGIIMEMEEEYSGSEKEIVLDAADNETWQDVQEENAQLKEQILNQIAIFEQYLKVAILQHKARLREAKDEVRLKGTRHSSVDNSSIFNRNKDFEFDDEKAAMKYPARAGAGKRGKSKLSKRQRKSKTGRENSYQTAGQVQSQATSPQVKKIGVRDSLTTVQIKERKVSATRSPILIQENNIDRSVLTTVVKVSREPSAESVRRSQKDPNGKKAIFVRLSKKVTPSIMKALEHLVPLTGGPAENTHIATHTAHQNWIQKIQKLWNKLNENGNQECVRLQNEIRKNKQHINELTRQNLFELDVNTNDQKLFLDARTQHRKFKKKMVSRSEIKQVSELQNRIRDEIGRKAEFDTWGFNDHIIQYRLKVRMTEDIIDCAQRLVVKADAKTQRELELLTKLRDRTYEDIRYFIEKREEKKWRLWDGFGGNYKPSIENSGLNFEQILQRIDINLLMIAYIEPRYWQLVRDVPPYNMINSEMIQFCTLVFGNEGWLQIFQIRRLRKQQEAEQNDKQYMPPVAHIKRLAVDPYTLQIESEPELQTDVEGKESRSPKVEPLKAKESVWKIRKPEKPNQARLKTGYEPIIAERLQGKQSSIIVEKVDDEDLSNDEKIAAKETFKKHGSIPIEQGKQINDSRRRNDKSNVGSQDSIEIKSNSLPPQSETPAGFGINKFEGDVVKHLKNQVAQHDRQEKVKEEVKAIQKSSWLQVLERERLEKAQREVRERAERAARLAILFEEEDILQQDDEDILDAGAAHRDFVSYADKIDTHLQVEKRLLEAWNENDKREGGPSGLSK